MRSLLATQWVVSDQQCPHLILAGSPLSRVNSRQISLLSFYLCWSAVLVWVPISTYWHPNNQNLPGFPIAWANFFIFLAQATFQASQVYLAQNCSSVEIDQEQDNWEGVKKPSHRNFPLRGVPLSINFSASNRLFGEFPLFHLEKNVKIDLKAVFLGKKRCFP